MRIETSKPIRIPKIKVDNMTVSIIQLGIEQGAISKLSSDDGKFIYLRSAK